MQLYSVYFTQKHTVTKYNRNGKKIGEYVDDIPHALHALPYSTAMQYATCDNFRLERYYLEQNQQAAKNHNRKSSRGDNADYMEENHDLKQAALTGNLATGLNAA